jgi:hypothetical protein
LYDFDGVGFPPNGAGVPWVGKQGEVGQTGAQGAPGMGITYKGTVSDASSLPATAASGDLYIVSEPAPAHGFVWDGDTSAWVDAGPVQGPQGVPGVDGRDGVDGAPGKDGEDSTVPGPPGPTIPATATVLGGVKIGAGITVDADGTISSSAGTGFLPLTGGTMTGTITLPSGTVGMAVNGTGYNMVGGSGGVAFRNNTSNIINHTAAEVVAFVPITTSGGAVGVRFGSGGPSLSKSGTSIAASAPITVASEPAADTELANKKYVDDQVAAGGGSDYTLPAATDLRLGGVKVGSGLAVTADGTLSSSVAGNYLLKTGDVMTGALRFAQTGVSTYNGTDVYMFWDGTYFRCKMPGTAQAWIAGTDGKVQFPSAVPSCNFAPTATGDLTNKKYVDDTIAANTVFLKVSGGTMTGTITTPTTVPALTFGTSGYNLFGASGGVAVRSNTTNIVNVTASEFVAYKPITTAGTGVGVRFGSGGPSLSKSGTSIASSAPITVDAAPTAATELANKAYVDAAAGGGVANPVAGSTSGLTLWLGSQAAYDAIATKDAKTIYYIV